MEKEIVKMSGKKREYSSLDTVFNNLQVSPVEERHRAAKKLCDVTCIEDTPVLNNRVERAKIALGKKLNSQRRRTHRRCVIRKAKLILPKKFTSKNEKERKDDGDEEHTKNGDDENDEEGDDDVFLNENETIAMSNATTSRCATPTCGTQFLQQQCSTSSGSSQTSVMTGQEETSPDELASYFEQILFIPKPMSLMAQMMYA